MLIDRENYGAFFLDYFEGKLDAAGKEGLMAFLEQNPDLKAEMAAFGTICLVPPDASFSNKHSLKKQQQYLGPIAYNDLEHYCIAKMEGDLTAKQSAEFDKIVEQKPEALKTYKLYLKTLLEPDKSIVFSDKQVLRRRIIKPMRNHWLVAASVAASVSLIILSYQVYDSYRFEEKKIYTAIHEKLKIDSLLNKVISTPTNNTVVAQNIAHTSNPAYAKNIVSKDTIYISHTRLREKLPIEIVELSVPEPPPIMVSAKFQKPERELNNLQRMPSRSDYLALKQYATNELKKKLEQQEINIEKSLKFWDVAAIGVKQMNKLTGLNLQLIKENDSVTNRQVFAFQSNILGIYSSTTKKNDSQ